jgi:hypothetical protein
LARGRRQALQEHALHECSGVTRMGRISVGAMLRELRAGRVPGVGPLWVKRWRLCGDPAC